MQENCYPCILVFGLDLRVKRVTIGFLLSNLNTKLCIRVKSESNSKVRVRVTVRVRTRVRVKG